MDTAVLRAKIKQNLIINYNTDDDLIDGFADAAVAYAEKYQHLDSGYYAGHDMSATTEQAVIMLASHFSSRATVQRADSSRITFRRANRLSPPPTACCGSTGNGRCSVWQLEK